MAKQMRMLLLLATLIALPWGGVAAQERWTANKAEKPDDYIAATAEKREPAPSGIPDMLTAIGPEGGDIAKAWYANATGRYRHGALGDTLEGGALHVQLASGRTVRHMLPETEVFEDIAPRIADLDGDGQMEVVTILSSLLGGSAVAVFGMAGESLVRKGATRFIGTPNRWLNIAGIDRFTGAGTPEIAFVVTPHIGGILYFAKYVPNGLLVLTGTSGFSNHVFGSKELRLSATADIDGDGRMEIAIPSADRKRLRIMGFANGKLREVATADLPAAVDKAIGMTQIEGKTVFLAGTEDGSIYEISN